MRGETVVVLVLRDIRDGLYLGHPEFPEHSESIGSVIVVSERPCRELFDEGCVLGRESNSAVRDGSTQGVDSYIFGSSWIDGLGTERDSGFCGTVYEFVS